MNEPVNIMGVMAFPNPNGVRDIRFVDSRYNTLFEVPDGGNVVIRHPDGSISVQPCLYIDDYHARIGNYVYHIHEFAEIMEQNGNTYEPEQCESGDDAHEA